MKKFLLTSISLLFVGCAYIAPTIAPKLSKKVTGHEVPNWKGLTLSGIVKATDKELDYHKAMFELNYKFAKHETSWIIETTENVSQSILGIIAGLSPFAAMVAHKAGLKTKRPGDVSKEEHAVAVNEALHKPSPNQT